MEIANITITNEESYWPKQAIQDSTNSQFNDTCQVSKTNCKSLHRTLVICSCGKGKNRHERCYMRTLPITNTAADLYSKVILETNKTKLIPTIMLPIITAFMHNEHNTAKRMQNLYNP